MKPFKRGNLTGISLAVVVASWIAVGGCFLPDEVAEIPGPPPACGTFGMAVSPADLAVVPGGSYTVQVTLSRYPQYMATDQSIDLSLSAPLSQRPVEDVLVDPSFDPEPTQGNSTLTFAVTSDGAVSTPGETYTFTIHGYGGPSRTCSANFSITFQSDPGEVVLWDNFDTGDPWTVSAIRIEGTVAYPVVNRPSGGIDDSPYREMVHQIDGVGVLILFHRYDGTSYTPSGVGAGAIGTIDYVEAHAMITPAFTGAQMLAGPALEQNGIVYEVTRTTFSSTAWEQEQRIGLTANDFTAADGSHPDFSASGAEIWFGYTRATSNTVARTQFNVHGIDNWQVKIHRPQP